MSSQPPSPSPDPIRSPGHVPGDTLGPGPLGAPTRRRSRFLPLAVTGCGLMLGITTAIALGQDTGRVAGTPGVAVPAPVPADDSTYGAAGVVPQAPFGPPGSLGPSGTRPSTGGYDAATVADVDYLDLDSRALAAYQRAVTVIGEADERCGLTWHPLAAIGQVASAHGTAGGGTLVDETGVVRPALIGEPLDGRAGRAKQHDTDRGSLDRDQRWDRPVGPMQLTPDQWSQIGVDADADGRRDPQDLDDAALAVAVALCAGPGDLGEDAALRAAVRRLQPVAGDTATVVRLAAQYLETEEAAAAAVPAPIAVPLPAALPGPTGVRPARAARTPGDAQAGAGTDLALPAGGLRAVAMGGGETTTAEDGTGDGRRGAKGTGGEAATDLRPGRPVGAQPPKPTKPTKPGKPAKPGKPTKPGKPGKPEVPTEPETPVCDEPDETLPGDDASTPAEGEGTANAQPDPGATPDSADDTDGADSADGSTDGAEPESPEDCDATEDPETEDPDAEQPGTPARRTPTTERRRP